LRHAVFSDLAEADLADIWVSIATDDIDTADRFLDELRALAQKLAELPHMGRVRADFGEQVRSFPYNDYLVIYRQQPDGIGIARVVHGRRDLRQIEVPKQ
jgi:toxin ParE1/3/4